MPSPVSPLLAESSGLPFDSLDAEAAQRLHASMRECRRLKVALTEAEEGWRDALSVAKSIQQKLKQKEEEVQSLRTLLALAPAERSTAQIPATPATPAAPATPASHSTWRYHHSQHQYQQQQQRQPFQQDQSIVADKDAECERLRKAVNQLGGQLQAALAEAAELKASCRLTPIEIEALKRESEVARRQLKHSEHFLQSLASAFAEQTNGGTVVYAELASAVADLVDLASTFAACELGGLAIFMGQELQNNADDTGPALNQQQLPGNGLDEHHGAENRAHDVLQQQLQRMNATNRRTTRLIQWIAAVTKYLRQQRIEQAVHVHTASSTTRAKSATFSSTHTPPTPAEPSTFATAQATAPAMPPAMPPALPPTQMAQPSSPASSVRRPEMTVNGAATSPKMEQPAMLRQHNQNHSKQTQNYQQSQQHQLPGPVVTAADPPRLSQLRESGVGNNRGTANISGVHATTERSATQFTHSSPPPVHDRHGPGNVSPSRAQSLAAVQQQLHRTTEVIRSIPEHRSSHATQHSPHTSDSQSQSQSPGADTVQVANIVQRVAYDSAHSRTPKLKSSSRSPSPRKARRRHRHNDSPTPTPGLIQQIVTEKLHRVVADLLKTRKSEEEATQTKSTAISVPAVAPEMESTLQAEQSGRSEFCLNDFTVLEPANTSSETEVNVAQPKPKFKARKNTSKIKRRSASQPRYAASTAATTRRRQLMRGNSEDVVANHQAAMRSSSANSTPDSAHRPNRRSTPQYVTKLLR